MIEKKLANLNKQVAQSLLALKEKVQCLESLTSKQFGELFNQKFNGLSQESNKVSTELGLLKEQQAEIVQKVECISTQTLTVNQSQTTILEKQDSFLEALEDIKTTTTTAFSPFP